MYYTFITKPTQRQVTFEEVYRNYANPHYLNTLYPEHNILRTFTVKQDTLTDAQKQTLITKFNIPKMREEIENFVKKYQHLLIDNMQNHYETFHIPKNSGGLRRIDAPKPELMAALSELKNIFEHKLHVLPHDNAFAYVRTRSTVDALQRHQNFNSKWFLKIDIKDFFPSCTPEFILTQLQKLFPFNLICENNESKFALEFCIKLCILNGGLPQGTPMSPVLTNLIMLPIDYELSKFTHNNKLKQHFCYTRYADDILISCQYSFEWQKVQNAIQKILRDHPTPFLLKRTKTRYGSSAGQNWNLGLMLNKDNNITIGYKQKQRFKAAIFTFLKDLTDGITWSTIDVQTLLGHISYYKKIEPGYIQHILDKYTEKFGLDPRQEMINILKN